jgi:anthranilate phosphoribosyltransferase
VVVVGGFLLALRQFTVNDIYYSAQEMVKHSIPCSLEDVMHAIDIVGTGGDALDTFNVSTAAGFIVAASGVPVAKHGNRSSSGRYSLLMLNVYLNSRADMYCGTIDAALPTSLKL